MQQVVHEFLELPLEEKNKVMFSSLDNRTQGYSTRQAKIEGAPSMWSDRLHYQMFPMSTRNHDLWPKNPSRFREVVERYSEEQNKLAKKLLELISESLGLKPSYINEYLGEDCVHAFIANYYPSCPQPELAMGLVKHSDPGALTILLQDTNSGLQVLKDGQWITVKPIEGAFVVNLGDHMEIATNGRYKSIEHRAFVSSQPRLIIAMFTNPTDESIVGPIPELLVAEELPKYKQCSFGEFRTLFLKSFLGRTRQTGKKHMHTFMAQPTLEVTAS
jgi:isopenicillin N synthase-like dioxygenase